MGIPRALNTGLSLRSGETPAVLQTPDTISGRLTILQVIYEASLSLLLLLRETHIVSVTIGAQSFLIRQTISQQRLYPLVEPHPSMAIEVDHSGNRRRTDRTSSSLSVLDLRLRLMTLLAMYDLLPYSISHPPNVQEPLELSSAIDACALDRCLRTMREQGKITADEARAFTSVYNAEANQVSFSRHRRFQFPESGRRQFSFPVYLVGVRA